MMKSRMFRSIAVLITVISLVITSLYLPAAMAETTNAEADRSIFFGKVTAIDGNAVTIAIGTLDMPEVPGQDDGNSQNNPPAGNPSTGGEGQSVGIRSFFDSLALTGELVTVQITSAVTLTKQSARPAGRSSDTASGDAMKQEGSQGNASAGQPQGTPPSNAGRQREPGAGGMGGFLGGGEEASLSDLTVDDVVMLTYQTSTQALLALHILSLPKAN